MPEFSAINPWAVLVAAASAFMLGGLWYGPLFLKAWGRAAGIDVTQSPKHPGRTFGTAFVLSLVAAFAMALALPKDVGVAHGAGLGALIGLLFVATSFGINYTFARKPLTLWLIDGGYHVVQFLLYGAILGAWH
ncbi:DUF1761 domain-containing protein [Lysobacter sp. TY2-98]|uniref:DUF1761 domain-containing protein n=1 Tax=Lysobacter sp. TY2-98 TaxID=2290922 RepID=UPI000E205472|nr:DUF1761 domain-containing protein [Lysobacter sp. TY2-98]AXK72854.1 DUF1761 domain-containing protein [Lysobacter sp. TY2-98]